MTLEDIEQKTLGYLKQVSNPLVRIDVLYSHLEDTLDLSFFSIVDLKSFLEKHELFRVMNPPSVDAEATTDITDAFVILDARIPSQEQTAAMMLEQLDRMGEALNVALVEARDLKDTAKADKLYEALQKTTALKDRLLAIHADSDDPPA